MPLPATTRLGPYEILGLLGAGGMGEVYRGRDTRLGREVAIKVLPSSFFENSEALARFEREAKIVAALSHPNILAIHDVGTQEATAFAVTELLEGDTLRQRLRSGPLPVRKALDFALQIAHGLGAAHEKGIVHRDLKPENLFVTKDARVKILDFGLARQDPMAESTEDTSSPTLSRPTHPGVRLGTVGYMSPEQVRGARADHRADIFSFGAVLYEMLSGKRAFLRATAAETMTAILREDVPEFSGTAGPIPVALDRIVRRCLEKTPDERFDTAHDLGFALEAVELASGRSEASADAGARPRSTRWPFPAGLVVGALVGAGLALWLSPWPSVPETPSLRYLTSSGFDSAPSASPDGRMIAFRSTRDGRSRIWLKQIAGGGEAALTAGPDDNPRFSPDGSSVLFVRAEGERFSLYRTALLGGETRKIVEDVVDGDWSPGSRQVAFVRWRDEAGQRNSYLGAAGADGRDAREVARVPGQALRGVRWSPDGRRLAAVWGGFRTGTTVAGIFIVGADGTNPQTIKPPRRYGFLSSVAWLRGGEALVYSQAEWVSGDMTGSMARVIRHEIRSGASRAILWTPHSADVLDILGPGRLVLDTRSPRENLKEAFLRPQSASATRWLSRGNSSDRQPVYSPEGEWVIFASTRSGNSDLWEISTQSGALRRLIESPAEDVDPAVSPDGGTLIFTSDRSGCFEIWIAARDGGNPRQVTKDGFDAENATTTPDGRWLVYASAHPEKAGIWKIRADGTEATSLVAGTYLLPEVSPDGQYALYLANPGSRQPVIRVLRVADGTAVPFEIPVVVRRSTWVALGRARWMPGGRAIAFVGQDETGLNGVFVQDFVSGQDTSRTRRPLGGFDPEAAAESFGIAPDGLRFVVAGSEQVLSIAVAEGLTGIDSPLRGPP